MASATRDDVLRALDGIIDPVSGRSVVQQDMIQGLVIRDGNVGFAVEVDPGRGPSAEPLRKACEDVVAALPGGIEGPDVAAGRECGWVGRADAKAGNFVIRDAARQPLSQALDHRPAEGVQCLGAIQHCPGRASVDLEVNIHTRIHCVLLGEPAIF